MLQHNLKYFPQSIKYNENKLVTQTLDFTTPITPNQTQNDKVPTPTVTFIKSDNSKTIPATITGIDDYHKIITAVPSTALSAGTRIR